MHLEDQLAALTAALNANTAALLGKSAPAAAPTAAPAAAKPKAPAAEKGALTYDDIKVPFLALCKAKGADVGRELCKKFGHENLKTVKPEQFPEVLKEIQAQSLA